MFKANPKIVNKAMHRSVNVDKSRQVLAAMTSFQSQQPLQIEARAVASSLRTGKTNGNSDIGTASFQQ